MKAFQQQLFLLVTTFIGYSDHVIKCQDSVDDGCGSTLLDSYVSIYDTDPLMADNALRIASTNELTFRVAGEENGILTTPLKEGRHVRII